MKFLKVVVLTREPVTGVCVSSPRLLLSSSSSSWWSRVAAFRHRMYTYLPPPTSIT